MAIDSSTGRTYRLSVSPHYGFIVPHTSQMSHLLQGHSYAAGIEYTWTESVYKKWRYCYNHPETGFLFFLNYSGNREQLGHQYSLQYFINLVLNRQKTREGTGSRDMRWHWLGLGVGPGIATKIWDLQENHQAPVLGSHLNVSLTLQYTFRLFANQFFAMRSGFRIHHYSNGAFSIPNLGTNNLSFFVSAGIKSGLRKISQPLMRGTEPIGDVARADSTCRINHTIALSSGLKEIPPPLGKKYVAYSCAYSIDRRLSYKSSLGAGLDAFYNAAVKKLLERRDDYSPPFTDVLQLGAAVGYTLHLSRFQIRVQTGFYLLDKWKDTGRFYHRFGLRYHFTQHLFVNMSLKTHFAKADFGELGIGWKF